MALAILRKSSLAALRSLSPSSGATSLVFGNYLKIEVVEELVEGIARDASDTTNEAG